MEGVGQQHTRSPRADGVATQCRGGQQGLHQSSGSTASAGTAELVSPRARARSPPQPLRQRSTDEPLPALTVFVGETRCIFSGSTASSGVFRISDPCSEAQATTLRPPAAAAPPSSRPASGSAPAPRVRSNRSSEARGQHEGCIARTVKKVAAGLRRCVPDNLSRRCQALSLPRAVADVRHLMDALYYEEIGFLILRSCLGVVHTSVFLYSCATEKPFEAHAYVALLLGLVSVLTMVRVFCQYQIVKALARLRWMWWQRAVLPDFVKLLCSPLWQLQRVLFLVSFSLYFVALHVAYHRGTIIHLVSADAPILMRYISLVVLIFLSVLGPHILMVALVCTCLIVCWCTPAEELQQLLVEAPRGAGRALPARLLQLMQEERWVPPDEGSRRGSSSDKCSSASGGRRGSSETTHGVDEKKQQAIQGGEAFSEQSTGLTVKDCSSSGGRSKRGKGTCEARDTQGEVDAEPRKDFMCAICLTDFYEGDVIRRLPCRHVFHSACITRWLSSHATCPLRCYVNFSVDVVGPPFYGARRCLRSVRSQLSRRARARSLLFSRHRRSRHTGQRRSSARLQRADQTHRQGQQEADQPPPEPVEDGDEEGNLEHSAKTQGDLFSDRPATADACADSAAADYQTLADELAETAICVPVISEEEEGHHPFSIRQTDAAAPGEEVLQPSRELEDGGVIAAEVPPTPEAGWSSAGSSSSAASEGTRNEDDKDMYLACRTLADTFEDEKGGKIQAAGERGTGIAQQQGSAVSLSRAAPGGALPGVSIESAVRGP